MKILPTKNKHDNCEVVIVRKLWSNRLHPVPGLYCAQHGNLIKWLRDSHADELIANGVEDLGMLESEKPTYNRRLRLLNRETV